METVIFSILKFDSKTCCELFKWNIHYYNANWCTCNIIERRTWKQIRSEQELVCGVQGHNVYKFILCCMALMTIPPWPDGSVQGSFQLLLLLVVMLSIVVCSSSCLLGQNCFDKERAMSSNRLLMMPSTLILNDYAHG